MAFSSAGSEPTRLLAFPGPLAFAVGGNYYTQRGKSSLPLRLRSNDCAALDFVEKTCAWTEATTPFHLQASADSSALKPRQPSPAERASFRRCSRRLSLRACRPRRGRWNQLTLDGTREPRLLISTSCRRVKESSFRGPCSKTQRPPAESRSNNEARRHPATTSS